MPVAHPARVERLVLRLRLRLPPFLESPSAGRDLARRPRLRDFGTPATARRARTQHDCEEHCRPHWYVYTPVPTLPTADCPSLGSWALARCQSRPLRRFLSTDIAAIEASTDNSLKQVQSLEAQLNTHLHQPLRSIDPESPPRDHVAAQYHLYKQQGTPYPTSTIPASQPY